MMRTFHRNKSSIKDLYHERLGRSAYCSSVTISPIMKSLMDAIENSVDLPSARYQSWVQISASTASGVKQLRKSLIIHSLVLKADSAATEEAGMASRSLAMQARIGYLVALPIHHFKMSNS